MRAIYAKTGKAGYAALGKIDGFMMQEGAAID